jgi:predicted small secreted protein
MADLLRFALLLGCAGLSACASVRGAPGGGDDRRGTSAKAAEALRGCRVAQLTANPLPGASAPTATAGRTFNGYAITYPQPHTGILVYRNEDGSSRATWEAVDAANLAPINRAVRACAEISAAPG